MPAPPPPRPPRRATPSTAGAKGPAGSDSKILKALKAPPSTAAVKGSRPPARPSAAAAAKPSPPRRSMTPSPGPKAPASLRPGRVKAVAPRRDSGGASAAWKGLSLQWKIVVAMALITMIAGLATFVASYTTATTQLERQVDQKGIAVVQTLSTIDESMWISALYFPANPATRADDLATYLKQGINAAFGGPDWFGLLGQLTEAEALWNQCRQKMMADVQATGALSPDTTAFCADAARRITGIAMRQDPETFEIPLERRTAVAAWLRLLQNATGPVDAIRRFQEAGELSAITVTFTPKPGSVYAAEEQARGRGMTPAGFPNQIDRIGMPRTDAGVVVQDVSIPTTGGAAYHARSFQMTRDGDQGQLLFIAYVRVAQIQAARQRLMLMVILAILGAIVLGVAAAIFVSNRITKPLRRLIDDVEEVKNGNLEHQTVPVTRDEIGLLAVTFNDMTGALKVAHAQELDRKALEHELTIAHQIQANLLPRQIPKFEPYELNAFYRPAKEVGGDYYDLIEIDEHHLGVVVADVSGKGVPGSMVMSMTRTLLRMETDRTGNLSPADTLRHVNRLLAKDIKKGMFVTAFYGVLDRRNHTMMVCSAGHNPLVVWRARKGEILLVNPSGIALGFDKGPLFDRNIKEEPVVLEPGDIVVGYTDGVVESMDADREEYGDKRFHALVKKSTSLPMNQLIQTIVRDLESHQGDAEQHDDITLVGIRRL